MANAAAAREAPSTGAGGSAPAGPCIMVVLGATGDLTGRLLTPALCNLARAKLLSGRFALLGLAHRDISTEAFRQRLEEAAGSAAADDPAWRRLAGQIFYMSGDFEAPETYRRLAERLAELDRQHGTGGNYLFYLATAPQFFAPIVARLSGAGLMHEQPERWRRVVIEKPFGQDLASARALNRDLLAALDESQIYRIDHYLGKETVQNIMVLRFANGIFEPIWNRDHIDHVQITVAETVGVEGRGRFYDATGALRDMVPNHVFQLLAMTAMEAPNSFAANAVRSEKVKVLDAIHMPGPENVPRNVVRGQYAAGMVQGRPVHSYGEEPSVQPGSVTETYVALKLMIDNWRWAGVPFYLRTGKAMARRRSEVAIRFKQAPFALFRDTPVDKLPPNWLVLRIQPDEGVSVQFGAKMPGPAMHLDRVKMDFHYHDYFASAPSTGYETLIYDCMIGDATLFQRADNIECGWSVVEPILEAWRSADASPPVSYAAGSEGPAEADALLARDGRSWRTIL